MDHYFLCSSWRRFSCCAVQALIVCFLFLVPAAAVDPDSSAEIVEDPAGGGVVVEQPPVQVYVVSPDVDVSEFLDDPSSYEVYSVEGAPSPVIAAVGDDFPFYGSCWMIGTAAGLGDVTLFFPINRQDGYVGLDDSGHIFNVSDSSWSGVMYDSSGTSYQVSFGSFALPRYRLYSGSSWDYETLYFTASESNLVLPDSPSPTYSVSDLLPWVLLIMLGGVLLCCMRKS